MNKHHVSTPPTGSLCPNCGVIILVALVEGLPVRVDPINLNYSGEIAALVAGRATYTQIRNELIHRDASRIAGGRFTGRPILADHRCGEYTPSHHRETASPIIQPTIEGIPF